MTVLTARALRLIAAAHPQAAERSIDVCQSLIDLAKIGLAAQNKPIKDVKICYDEWNVYVKVNDDMSVGLTDVVLQLG